MTYAAPTPNRFFRKLGNTELEGSHAFLETRQAFLRDNKASGLIEIQINPATQVILLFAHGVHAGNYLLENDNSKSVHQTDLTTLWDETHPIQIRTTELPHTAGRMLWLALESQIDRNADISSTEEWKQQSRQWKAEHFNGLIEVISEMEQGFFYILNGETLNSELVFFNGKEFKDNYTKDNINDCRKVIVHEPVPDSRAYRCFILRQGVIHWGNGMLGRYQALAGQKLVKIMQEDLKQMIQPFDWNIFIENGAIKDEHFFFSTETATNAYRALFMEIGLQIEQVVGSALTRRILNDAFESLNKDMRTALEIHRLIPAAFSE